MELVNQECFFLVSVQGWRRVGPEMEVGVFLADFWGLLKLCFLGESFSYEHVGIFSVFSLVRFVSCVMGFLLTGIVCNGQWESQEVTFVFL